MKRAGVDEQLSMDNEVKNPTQAEVDQEEAERFEEEIQRDAKKQKVTHLFNPPARVSEVAFVKALDQYKEMYTQSTDNSEQFWADIAEKNFHWHKKWDKISSCNFDVRNGPIKIEWFLNGKTNLCYNALDRHVQDGKGDQIAYYFEGNNLGEEKTITYKQLLELVCKISNALKSFGVNKGDRVALYLAMGFELVATILACARIGAVHTVIFAGFSAQSISKRLLDGQCKIVFTSDGVYRGPKLVHLKENVDEAIALAAEEGLLVEHCVVYRRIGEAISVKIESRDVWFHELMDSQSNECPVEWLDAEDPLFILYTSGSTGKPKGVLHTQGGYMVYAATTFKYIFDYHPGDVYWCTADVGWITGHSYVVYGPLLNCATSVLFEGMPTYPAADRFWAVIDKYQVTQFYTAPTAIRALIRYGDDMVNRHNLRSLRILGSVGEPINPETWMWYHNTIGHAQCSIVDTWWQTETGGILITPLPGATPAKPGSATFPFFGVQPAILDKHGNEIVYNQENKEEAKGYLVIKKPWPGIMRTVYGDHARFEEIYFKHHAGYYTTGDGCKRDKDGYYWLTGRIDDVLKVSGHLLSTAEIESALVSYKGVTEAAVVPVPHDIKGEAVYAFVTLAEGQQYSQQLRANLLAHVGHLLGPVYRPDVIHWAPALPKTRSGKIMRRILRKIATGEERDLGDVSTLADVNVIQHLVDTRGK